MGEAGVWFTKNNGASTPTEKGSSQKWDRLGGINQPKDNNLPTRAEFNKLIEVCDTEWVADYEESGVSGLKFTHKENGNVLFFPATSSDGLSGSYPTSTVNTNQVETTTMYIFSFTETEQKVSNKTFTNGIDMTYYYRRKISRT